MKYKQNNMKIAQFTLVTILILGFALLVRSHSLSRQAKNPTGGACKIERRSTVPIRITPNFALVPVVINLLPADFFIDTGAQRTVVSEQAANQLALARDTTRKSNLTGIGGTDSQPLALPESLTLGGLPLHRNVVPPDDSLAVGPMPIPGQFGRPPIGALGQDYLSAFDLDLNMVHGIFSLFTVSGCSSFLPWPSDTISAIWHAPAGLVFSVTVNGKKLTAVLDTAAQMSVILQSGTEKLRLSSDCNGVNIEGFGHDKINGCIQKITLGIGDKIIPNFWVVTTLLKFSNQADMLVGLDWLKDRHVWISNATNKLFVAEQTREPPSTK